VWPFRLPVFNLPKDLVSPEAASGADRHGQEHGRKQKERLIFLEVPEKTEPAPRNQV
jgi:hypothetical protein